jgi:Flp pilus assembly protein protease CpaA
MEVTTLLLIYAGILVGVGMGTDLKWREVPDWLNYAALAAGIGTRIFAFLTTFDWQWLIAGAAGIAVAFAISWIMFHAGQWGGGDAKMLIALGAILGVSWTLETGGGAFFINLLVAGAIYGILWTFVTALRHRHACGRELNVLRSNKAVRLTRIIAIALAAILALIALLLPSDLRLPLLILAIVIPTLVSLGVVIKAVEQGCMLKRISVNKLTEGDWIVKDVKVNGKRITGPSDLGISIRQIHELRKLAAKGKITTVLIKEGMPFVPSFTLAFILYVTMGNVLLWFLT